MTHWTLVHSEKARTKDSNDSKKRTKFWNAGTKLEMLLEQDGLNQHEWFERNAEKEHNGRSHFQHDDNQMDLAGMRNSEWIKIGEDTSAGKKSMSRGPPLVQTTVVC